MAPDVELARQQVERLLHSRTFETSEVHRRLLQFLAEKTLAGEADGLKEYTIGLEAFSKPDSYDPKHDSIVRLQVSRLRQKLMAYYQEEGPADPVIVSVPKGAFKLVFENAEATAVPAPAPASLLQHPRRDLLLAAALAVITIWAAFSTVAWLRARGDARPVTEVWNSELKALWDPFLESKRPLLVCLGTPMFLRFPDLGFFRDPRTNDLAEAEQSSRVDAIRRHSTTGQMFPLYPFTGTGEASAGIMIAKLLGTRRPDLSFTRSNILSWQQIVDNNLVFIGPPKFNPQLQAAGLAQEIVVEAGGLHNLKPKPGEPEFLQDQIVVGKSADGETYALITRTSGPSGVGEVLIIAGNASPDTMAAAEWITEPWRAHELVNRLSAGRSSIPRHFQAVLRVRFKQSVPVHSYYVLHHVLPD